MPTCDSSKIRELEVQVEQAQDAARMMQATMEQRVELWYSNCKREAELYEAEKR